MHKRRTQNTSKKNIFLNIAAISVFSGIAAVFALMLIFALIMTLVDVSNSICSIISALILVIGAFISGMAGAFLSRRKGAVTGAVCGLAVCLVMILINAFVSGDAVMHKILIRFALTAASGAGGGIYGVNRHICRHPFIGLKQ